TALASGIQARPPRIPYLSNVTGTWITAGDLADPTYWARHLQGTVRFAEGLGELLRQPGRAWIEVGPGGTLGTLVRQHPGAAAREADLVTVPTLRRTGGSGSDLDDLVAAVGRLWSAGIEIDWERFHAGARRRRVSLPTYAFERRRFWIDPPASPRAAAPAAAGPPESIPAAPGPAPAAAGAAPGTDQERAVAGVWEELFGIAPIGAADSFFELGGHSLLAIQIMSRLRAVLGVDLPVTVLFENPTVAGLARVLAESRDTTQGAREQSLEELLARVEGLSAEEALEALDRPAAALAPQPPPPVRPVSGPTGVGDWPLSFDQERLLQLHLDNPELVSWNVDAVGRIAGPLDAPELFAAFSLIVRRHAAWRAAFPVVDGRRVQRVAPSLPPDVSVIDLTGLPPEMREPAGRQALFARTRAVYDLERGPLVRVALARLDANEHFCLIGVHHLVTDWITFHVCWSELLTIYEAVRDGRPVSLPPPQVQFPDFVLWEREVLQGAELQRHAAFWRRTLDGFPRVLELPADRPRPAVQSQRGGFCLVSAGSERTERLRGLAHRQEMTMF